LHAAIQASGAGKFAEIPPDAARPFRATTVREWVALVRRKSTRSPTVTALHAVTERRARDPPHD